MSISKFYLDGFIDIDESRDTNTFLSFRNAKLDSDYVRILKLCAGGPKTLKEIYPGVNWPMAAEVVALAKQGYLQKCTKEKYICNLKNRLGKVWYYTTDKGRELVDRVLSTGKTEKTSKTKTAADSAWQDMFAESMEAFASAMDAFSAAMNAYKTSLNL